MKMNSTDKQRSARSTITPPASSGASAVPAVHRISSEVLLVGRKELVIMHSGEEYRLRVTSKGKLILTK